ncbi:XdhC family protein [Paracoccus aestuariivivens]|uniref:XdhC family protein n=1 Tax=Paracoccus aestuariivivens TaxID=1820333 RepID=UPI001478FF34|nr:XdhC family protein [Paracoccus aestuariivivens]
MKDQRIQVDMVPRALVRASDLPLAGPPAVALAFIVGTDGPSYRPVGATMVLAVDGSLRGSLSSGCIDADIAVHATRAAACGQGLLLRYGMGSPFRDLELPCGGGLDICVIPAPDVETQDRLKRHLDARQRLQIWISAAGLSVKPMSGWLDLTVDPDPRFAVFGKGPEAIAFARMTSGAGYETALHSPDPETLSALSGLSVQKLGLTGSVQKVAIDPFTAAVLFFHDHDHEPAILCDLLASPAFYVGAQGSRRAAERRLQELRAMGLPESQLCRLRGPIGVIPSTRDPRTLAASVLAEVLAEANQR